MMLFHGSLLSFCMFSVLCHLDFSTKHCKNSCLHRQVELVGTSWQCRQKVLLDETENESEFQTDPFEVKVQPWDGRLKILRWLASLRHRIRLWVWLCCWRLWWHNDVASRNSLLRAYQFFFLGTSSMCPWIPEWTDYICCIYLVLSPVGRWGSVVFFSLVGTSHPGVWRILWKGVSQQIVPLSCVGWYFWSDLCIFCSSDVHSVAFGFSSISQNCCKLSGSE